MTSMAIFIPPIWLLLLLLPLLPLVLLLIGAKSQNKQHPPGPHKLPIIGNLHQLGSLLHQSLWHLSKKHGPVMFLQLGTVPTVVISSAEAARQVLKVHDHECCSRPSLTGTGRVSYNHLDMAFSPYDHYWREMRKLCGLELFSTKKAQEFQHIREEEVYSLVNSIAQSSAADNTPVDLSEKCFALTTSIIFKTAFGKAFDGSVCDSHRLYEMVEEAEAALGCFYASDFFPYVGWIVDRLTGLHARLERSFHQLDGLYQHVIDYHLDPTRKKPEQEDMVDVLLRIEREKKELGGTQFTKDHIKAMLMDIFLAGVTSGSIAIIWAMTELARNPRIMRKAQLEVRDCVGKKGRVSERDIEGLQYLQMIVKETLRMHPPIPLLLSREVMSHFTLNGFDVYPKTRVEVNVWAIGRDPSVWTNPEEFFPERFSDSSIDFKGNHFGLVPFGSGRRRCPGMYIGATMVELALANLLYSFDWKLPSGMKEDDISMEEGPGLTAPKKSALVLVPMRYLCGPEQEA